ncbi:MAG TPA: hypothetical protein VMO26_01930 [Vicinamibacterales bacterium]|nr:hypothetical protein [Vicinamibacterales bacterium]
MKTLHDAADRNVFCVAALRADTSRRWGTMSAGAMVGHLCAATEMALGDLSTRPKGLRAFRTFPLKHLFLHEVDGVGTARSTRVSSGR